MGLSAESQPGVGRGWKGRGPDKPRSSLREPQSQSGSHGASCALQGKGEELQQVGAHSGKKAQEVWVSGAGAWGVPCIILGTVLSEGY